MKQAKLRSIAERFSKPEAIAIVLMGSYARGDQGTFSDLDVVRFLRAEAPGQQAETHLIDGVLVVVSDVTQAQAELHFTDPERATAGISGLRSAQALLDPQGYFNVLQERARAFSWHAAIQTKANVWASAQMVGWIEEVHKGLEGLARGDQGRLLNARHGLSWGLLNVMRVQQGVLITGDNGTFSEVIAHVGVDSPWAELIRQSFGLEPISLPEQVRAGLRLYVLTARLLCDVLRAEDRTLVAETIRRVETALGEPWASR